MKQLLMGNAAIGLGALRAGVKCVSGYPGTPSTEVLETIAKENNDRIHVEWSTNEKAALEVAAGASYCGCRALVTMKQVGLNVASDPLMSLAYVGVKGGVVVLVADDPGPISSQTEQDTRTFAEFSKLPVFDPASPEEAYLMIADAFDYSEKYHTPVLFRPTTRVCHATAPVELLPKLDVPAPAGFVRDPNLVIFPRLSFASHTAIEKRNPMIGDDFSAYRFNAARGKGKKGIVCGGISRAYTNEALTALHADVPVCEVATPFPFPEKLLLSFLDGMDEVLAVEELDPFLERELLKLAGKHHLPVTVRGKLTGDVRAAGENTNESVRAAVASFLGLASPAETQKPDADLPVRAPVLCAGCPHRASFYAVKQAMKGQKAVFTGDIGCYTLGNAAPLDMVDTCLCMGAGITIAQGIKQMEPDTHLFAFVGDSTFFASGLTGVANAVYNKANITVVILDNSTTAMTGHQPHPGTGKTMMGDISNAISIPAVLSALGVGFIRTVDPLCLPDAIAAAKDAASYDGVSAIIYKSPCIAVTKPDRPAVIDTEKCTGCRKCIRELGCPALVKANGKVAVDASLCTGCGLCTQVCPFGAITK